MRKLLVILLGAGTLAACSSTSVPQSHVVYSDCNDAKSQVKSNHKLIAHAFSHRDANAIGALELENRDIIYSNMKCFPNAEKQIKHLEAMHKDMSME